MNYLRNAVAISALFLVNLLGVTAVRAHDPIDLPRDTFCADADRVLAGLFHQLVNNPGIYEGESGWGLHSGIDVLLDDGSDLYALGPGYVGNLDEDYSSGEGNQNFILIHYSGFSVAYAHLKNESIPVSIGSEVVAGTVLAKAEGQLHISMFGHGGFHDIHSYDYTVNPLSHETNHFGFAALTIPVLGNSDPYCPDGGGRTLFDHVCYRLTAAPGLPNAMAVVARWGCASVYKFVTQTWAGALETVLDHYSTTERTDLPARSWHGSYDDIYYLRDWEDPSACQDGRQYWVWFQAPSCVPCTFTISMWAHDVWGNQSDQWTSPYSVPTQASITELLASPGPHQVALSWHAEGLTIGQEMEIRRSSDAGCSFSVVGTRTYQGSSDYQFTDNTCTQRLEYRYVIGASGSWGPVGATPTDVTLPPIPSAPTGVAGQSDAAGASIRVHITSGVSSSSAYKVHYDTDGPPYAQHLTMYCEGLQLSLTAGVVYHLAFSAWNEAGEGASSGDIQIRPLPAPVSISAQAGYRSIEATWTPVAQASSYRVRVRSDLSSYDQVFTSEVPMMSISNLQNGTPYTVSVCAVDEFGNATVDSPPDLATPQTFMGLDADLSSLVVPNDQSADSAGVQLLMCPAGEVFEFYSQPLILAATLRDSSGQPIADIPANEIEFHLQPAPSLFLRTSVSCSPVSILHPTSPSDANGVATLALVGGGHASPDRFTVSATVHGIPLEETVAVEVRSPDFNADGAVNLTDFAIFGSLMAAEESPAYGNLIYWSSDDVTLEDFAMFGRHMNHGCEEQE